jgi:hypothetical protein
VFHHAKPRGVERTEHPVDTGRNDAVHLYEGIYRKS